MYLPEDIVPVVHHGEDEVIAKVPQKIEISLVRCEVRSDAQPFQINVDGPGRYAEAPGMNDAVRLEYLDQLRKRHTEGSTIVLHQKIVHGYHLTAGVVQSGLPQTDVGEVHLALDERRAKTGPLSKALPESHCIRNIVLGEIPFHQDSSRQDLP